LRRRSWRTGEDGSAERASEPGPPMVIPSAVGSMEKSLSGSIKTVSIK
jgi:hypothetical protein